MLDDNDDNNDDNDDDDDEEDYEDDDEEDYEEDEDEEDEVVVEVNEVGEIDTDEERRPSLSSEEEIARRRQIKTDAKKERLLADIKDSKSRQILASVGIVCVRHRFMHDAKIDLVYERKWWNDCIERSHR